MKKYMFSVVVLLTGVVAWAQQIDFGEYHSLLREDRVWVNYYDHIDPSYDSDFPEIEVDNSYTITYTYELRGDSVIDGIKYKKCYMKRGEKKLIYESENAQKLKEVDHPVAFLREEGLLVYCRYNDYPQDLFHEHQDYSEDEYLLYDFGDARAQVLLGSGVLEKVNLGGNFFNQYTIGFYSLIESIGNSSHSVLLFKEWLLPTCEIYNVSAISHVLDKDGNVIFKSKNYRPEPPLSTVNDLKDEGLKGDNRYYNLMGQPVSNPSAGIYIHNGKKVVVK